MNDKSCDLISDLIVPYADGDLPPADTRRVADHLADCPNCRAELRLLTRSIELAREVWQQSAARAPAPGRCGARPNRRRVYAAACLAACVAVLLLTAGPWLFSRWDSPSDAQVPEQVEQAGRSELSQELDIESLIAREGRSARLAAAARLLASRPELQEYKSQAERYLAEAYSGTTAVDGVLLPGLSPPNPGPSPPHKEPEL